MATAPLLPTPPAAPGRSTSARVSPQDGQWLFGRYRLEPAKQRLHADDRAGNLDARACAVLLCLLNHAEEVVPRATLIAEAWPGADAVFDSAVSKVMRRLRTALGDHSGHVLQTVYGEGYRLALPAVLLPPAPDTPDTPAPNHVVGAAFPPPLVASAKSAPDRSPPTAVPQTGTQPPPRASPPVWLLWLPWTIAALATMAAAALAWLLLHPAGAG